MDEVIEMILQYLFKFQDYESSYIEYLPKENYFELNSIYEGIDNNVNHILKLDLRIIHFCICLSRFLRIFIFNSR